MAAIKPLILLTRIYTQLTDNFAIAFLFNAGLTSSQRKPLGRQCYNDEMLGSIVAFISQTIRFATPLTFGALSGIWAERSGIINIAIEGMMLTAAFIGFVAAYSTKSLLLGLLLAIVCGIMLGLLHAFFAIQLRTDQIISGTAINILAVGATGYLMRTLFAIGEAPRIENFQAINIPLLSQIPLLGPVLFQNKPLVYLMFIAVLLSHLVLYYTPWGIWTRAAGEHPQALASVGLKVVQLRYINMAISGALAGIGGAFFTLENVGQFTEGMTNGKGFIALAVMIFGKWTPLGAFLAALLFGSAESLQIFMQLHKVTLPFTSTPIPYQFLLMLPYVLTILVLAGLVGRSTPPKSLGETFPN